MMTPEQHDALLERVFEAAVKEFDYRGALDALDRRATLADKTKYPPIHRDMDVNA